MLNAKRKTLYEFYTSKQVNLLQSSPRNI